MSSNLNTTASALKAILCFIDPEKTPKIAYDRDDLAQPLIDKIKSALGERDGSQSVSMWFDNEEEELKRQFNGVSKNIKSVFNTLYEFTNVD